MSDGARAPAEAGPDGTEQLVLAGTGHRPAAARDAAARDAAELERVRRSGRLRGRVAQLPAGGMFDPLRGQGSLL